MGTIWVNKFCVIDIIHISKSGLSSDKILKFFTPNIIDTIRLNVDNNFIEIKIVSIFLNNWNY